MDLLNYTNSLQEANDKLNSLEILLYPPTAIPNDMITIATTKPQTFCSFHRGDGDQVDTTVSIFTVCIGKENSKKGGLFVKGITTGNYFLYFLNIR